MRDLKALAINLLLYKIGWFGGVLAAARNMPWAGGALIAVLIGVHLWLVGDRQRELRIILTCGLLGAVIDSAQMQAGVLTFEGGFLFPWLCPPWIILMWMQMGTTLRYCLRFLQGRPLVAALMGGVAGPLSFHAGERMGAVTLHPNPQLAIASLAISWTVAMPLMMWLARPHSSAAITFTGAAVPE
ncbi:MAG: DUF2878 domain-containing protein [Gemmatimonadota bacterium]|nr:DUF2878 domain-containing protein [Gemmatimonadota bacterium]